MIPKFYFLTSSIRICIFLFTLLLTILLGKSVYTQAPPTYYSSTTTLPILYINPNPQIEGLAEIGMVSSDVYSDAGQTQNPALLSRNHRVTGIKANVTTWPEYNPYTYLANLGLFYSFDSLNTIAYSFEYFNLGNIRLDYNFGLICQPYEYYHSLRFAHSFSEKLSAGAGVKVIKSDLAPTLFKAFKTFSIDLGIDYRKVFLVSGKSKLRWDIGLSVLDLGPKIKASKNTTIKSDNIPIDVALGTMLSYNQKVTEKVLINFDLAYQIEKLVVPSPDIYSSSKGWTGEIQKGNNTIPVSVDGYFGSFIVNQDSLKIRSGSFIQKLGVEVRVHIKEIMLAFRSGKLNEFETKGLNNDNTLGMSIGYKGFRFDYSALSCNNKSISTYGLCYTIILENHKSKIQRIDF